MNKKLIITRDRKGIEQYCISKCEELKKQNCEQCPLNENKFCLFKYMTDRNLTVAYDKLYTKFNS
jgi:hypothetical protein